MGKTSFRIRILNYVPVSLLFYLLLSPTLTYSATLEKNRSLKNTRIVSHSNLTIQKATLGGIDFTGTNPTSTDGVIIVGLLDISHNTDETATAHIQVRNVTKLWYKLYVKKAEDVNFDSDPFALKDDQVKYLNLSPECLSSFVYPSTYTAERQTLYQYNFFATADVNVAAYQWDSGDGNTATGRNISQTYIDKDQYDVTLTLSIANGGYTEVTQTIYTGSYPALRE